MKVGCGTLQAQMSSYHLTLFHGQCWPLKRLCRDLRCQGGQFESHQSDRCDLYLELSDKKVEELHMLYRNKIVSEQNIL